MMTDFLKSTSSTSGNNLLSTIHEHIFSNASVQENAFALPPEIPQSAASACNANYRIKKLLLAADKLNRVDGHLIFLSVPGK